MKYRMGLGTIEVEERQINRLVGRSFIANDGSVKWEYMSTSTYYVEQPLIVAEAGNCYVVRFNEGGYTHPYYEVIEMGKRYSGRNTLYGAIATMRHWAMMAKIKGN